MLSALAQATYEYTYTTTTAAEKTGLAAFIATYFLFVLVVGVFSIVMMWMLYKKAGRNGWEAIVPVYNGWVYCEIAGRPGWWVFLFAVSIIPVVGPLAALALHVVLAIDFAKSFGKDPIWVLLLVLVPPVGYAILALDKNVKYVGPGGKKSGGSSKPAAAKA